MARVVFHRRNVLQTSFCLALLLWAGGLRSPAAQEQAADPRQALRDRVEKLYRILQLRQWTQAEAYLAKGSVENFRKQTPGPFLAFQVDSIKIKPDGQTATVVVNLTIMASGVAMPMVYPRTTEWRLEEGVWGMVVTDPVVSASQSPFTASPGQSASGPPPEELKFKGHRYGLGVMPKGAVKVATFPFTNATDHVVRITEILTGCECLQVKTTKMEYKPGESGELVIEFNSAGQEYGYGQTIVVKTDPGALPTYLRVDGQVVPPEFSPPKTTEEKKP